MPLPSSFQQQILAITGATSFSIHSILQELWSGYGQILKIQLKGSSLQSVIIKHVNPPTQNKHPRGWNSSLSHERKLSSYQNESTWYQNWSSRCTQLSRIPKFLGSHREDGHLLLILEDLDAAGYPARCQEATWKHLQLGLSWLAEFHATFLGNKANDLWQTGTYWHLETRPDELAALNDAPLREAAPKISAKLNQARFQTIVHGDAKLANFCFSQDHSQLAALDFQYVGGGCGMKDVAYLVGSCLHEDDCAEKESAILAHYFSALESALARQHPQLAPQEIISEWRALYPFAWADFHRFLKGWSPGHWKLNSYSEQQVSQVLAQLSQEAL